MKPCVKRCRSQRGLMLIELLLALAVTGMVAAAMSSMLWAVSYGTSSSKGLRALAVKTKTLQSRLGGAIRGAAMVLDAGEDFLVLWVDDADGDGQPSLHEIQRIDRDAQAQTLIAYAAFETAQDVVYPLTTDFDQVTRALMGDAAFPGQVWATQVSGWSITLSQPDPQQASLVSYRLTLIADGVSETAIGAVALRR